MQVMEHRLWSSRLALGSLFAVWGGCRIVCPRFSLSLGWLEIAQRQADGCMLLRFILRHVP